MLDKFNIAQTRTPRTSLLWYIFGTNIAHKSDKELIAVKVTVICQEKLKNCNKKLFV